MYINRSPIFHIIIKELQDLEITKELTLQIAVKAINNVAGPNSLILILFIFSTYP